MLALCLSEHWRLLPYGSHSPSSLFAWSLVSLQVIGLLQGQPQEPAPGLHFRTLFVSAISGWISCLSNFDFPVLLVLLCFLLRPWKHCHEGCSLGRRESMFFCLSVCGRYRTMFSRTWRNVSQMYFCSIITKRQKNRQTLTLSSPMNTLHGSVFMDEEENKAELRKEANSNTGFSRLDKQILEGKRTILYTPLWNVGCAPFVPLHPLIWVTLTS